MAHVQLPPYVHQFPAPAVLIGCGTVETPNLITCAWFGTVASDPPSVAVAVRPERFSYPLLEEFGEFTVNIPLADQLEIVKYCGSRSGKDVNKFEALGLHPAACPPLEHAPMMEEAFIALACDITQAVKTGSHTLFIGEVKAVHARKEDVRPSKRAEPHAREQLVYLDGNYWLPAPAEAHTANR